MAKLVHILNKVDAMNGSQRQGADKINAIYFENTLFCGTTKQNKWNAVGLGSTFNLNIETKLQFFFICHKLNKVLRTGSNCLLFKIMVKTTPTKWIRNKRKKKQLWQKTTSNQIM